MTGMSVQLVKYDAACEAIAAARDVDELKDIRDEATLWKHALHQARNKKMEIQAAEIRFRAERRIGEMLQKRREMGALNIGGRPPKVETGLSNNPVTLKQDGIDKNLADRARKYADFSGEQFERLMAERREQLEKENARVTFSLLDANKEKHDRRATRERELAAKILALPTTKYGVIVADPEWQFQVWSRETGMDRAAENHYPTSPTEVIASRDVGSIAADDCALFLWTTTPMLANAILVMQAWGFCYKTNWAWTKDRIGMGFWNRSRHELLLLGTKGEVPCPAPGEQWESVIEAPRRGHSEKPEVFLEMIEQYFPTLPKIELNRRGPAREGWSAWGAEAEQQDRVA